MRTSVFVVLAVVLMMSAMAVPALAAPAQQGGGGVRFGAFTLESGARWSEDLIVFGGPVTLEGDSVLEGDLTVFGSVTIEKGARLDGELVVMGAVELAGRIEGSVFSAGEIELRSTAYVAGNVSALGNIQQAEGAVVRGTIAPTNPSFTWPAPSVRPPSSWPWTPRTTGVSLWWRAVSGLFRGFASVLLMGLLALVVASLWPAYAERAGRVVEEAPLNAFGVGLLTLILAGLLSALLAITICLSPFAVIALVVVGVGLLFGWVALGLMLGHRILATAKSATSTSTSAAIVGTVVLTAIVAAARIFGPLHALLMFVLLPLVGGAVVLTRFGTMPYATTGTPTGIRPAAGAPGLSVTRPPSSNSDAGASGYEVSAETPAPEIGSGSEAPEA